MGESQAPHFCDSGISGRVPVLRNPLFLSLEAPGYLKQIKKQPWNIFKNIVFL